MEKYITADEYIKEMGVDLSLELQDDDDPSNKVERFIRRTTDWCINTLTLEFQCADLLNWDTLLEVRQDLFRKGVMEQMAYILRNGLISLDSGYDATSRTIVSLENIEIGRDAMKYFKLGGFANIPRGGRRW